MHYTTYSIPPTKGELSIVRRIHTIAPIALTCERELMRKEAHEHRATPRRLGYGFSVHAKPAGRFFSRYDCILSNT